MLRRGFLLHEVQYVLGHSSARMTERYAHFAPTCCEPRVPPRLGSRNDLAACPACS